MTSSSLLILVLAAGMGTRMKSSHPKVMHKVGGKEMVGHVIDLGVALGADECAVVVGPEMSALEQVVNKHFKEAEIFVQEDRLGTAHAVLQARPALERGKRGEGLVLVLYGDTPLLTKEALQGLIDKLHDGADVGVLGFESDDPTGYGRLLLDEAGSLIAIREEKDASEEERLISFCNSGVMGFRRNGMLALLDEIDNKNANGEYYLTDAIEVARARGLKSVATVCRVEDVLGVNDRVQLSQAERIFQDRRRVEVQRGGATLIAPESVFFSSDTVVGHDVIIEPHVVFGPGVTIEDGAHIHSFCHIENAVIGPRSLVGPYARLRPGTVLGQGAKVGNFVEIKKATIQDGAKVNHLTYIGDADIGARANIGAGTITCNYDGFFKHKTVIGEESFVGSNSSLIAPVTIGKGAFIGSGSVISENVPDDALAITRPKRQIFERWAARYRAAQQRKKQSLNNA